MKAIFEFFGQEVQDAELYDIVLCMEQIMSTGGGWQDQVGGVTAGVKMITTEPGINQVIQVENVVLSEATKRGAAGAICADLYRTETFGEKFVAGCCWWIYRWA